VINLLTRENNFMSVAPRRTAAAALAASALLLTGCQDSAAPAAPGAPESVATGTADGIAELSGEQILEQSKVALQQAGSFRLTAARTVGELRMTGDLQAAGDGVTGTVLLIAGTAAPRVQEMSVGGQQYVKGGADYWTVLTGDPARAKAITRRAGSRWVRTPAPETSIAGTFGLAGLLKDLQVTGMVMKGPQTVVKSGTQQVPALTLTDSGNPHWLLYVATEGEPYPLQWETETASVSLSDAGKPLPAITEPPAGEVTDMATLVGQTEGRDTGRSVSGSR